MVSAVAPGYDAEILTLGGAMSGYCAIGNDLIANTPINITPIAITHANIGRPMKNLLMANYRLRFVKGH